ncbi:hypothetical protein [Tenacibaculum xiamenense]|uniref:hypothetical protein n=1 Tax=Tenacibaculum xiamenense TaxID=1261553 RepID=UPI003894D007
MALSMIYYSVIPVISIIYLGNQMYFTDLGYGTLNHHLMFASAAFFLFILLEKIRAKLIDTSLFLHHFCFAIAILYIENLSYYESYVLWLLVMPVTSVFNNILSIIQGDYKTYKRYKYNLIRIDFFGFVVSRLVFPIIFFVYSLNVELAKKSIDMYAVVIFFVCLLSISLNLFWYKKLKVRYIKNKSHKSYSKYSTLVG